MRHLPFPHSITPTPYTGLYLISVTTSAVLCQRFCTGGALGLRGLIWAL